MENLDALDASLAQSADHPEGLLEEHPEGLLEEHPEGLLEEHPSDIHDNALSPSGLFLTSGLVGRGIVASALISSLIVASFVLYILHND